MQSIWILVSGLLIGPAIYYLLPRLACRLRQPLADGCLPRQGSTAPVARPEKWADWLPKNWRRKLTVRLQRAGYFQKNAMTAYLGWMILPFPLLALAVLFTGSGILQPMLFGLLMLTLTNTWISKKIADRQKAYTMALYKIYRFLDLQLTAGIKITDSLKGLPLAIQHPIVTPILTRFSARYELTVDLDQSFAEIRLAFPGSDSELLSTHLRQCLQTGEAGRSLLRMEDLLFSRTFNLMQADTRKIRLHLMITAFAAMMPGLILFMFPLIYQAISAMQSVFG